MISLSIEKKMDRPYCSCGSSSPSTLSTPTFPEKSKCSFSASEVENLGHLVGKDNIGVVPKNIEAMQY
jgi:hypothetical protein